MFCLFNVNKQIKISITLSIFNFILIGFAISVQKNYNKIFLELIHSSNFTVVFC